jgi:CHAT domain-containing protein/tetratricopeptide (TPR) repeat protein
VQPQGNGHRITIVVILILASLISTPAPAQEARWKELDARVEQLYEQGKYNEALPVAEEALRVAEATFGAEHLNTATALSRLGWTYSALGKYDEAEPLYKRILAIGEESNVPDHPYLASILDNLAVLYIKKGKYAEAEPLFKRILAIDEKSKGPDHPDVATSLTNLVKLYSIQGRYAEAEPLFKRSLAIEEKSKGPDHPDVAASLTMLATFYFIQWRFAEAEPLYKRSLAIREKALGADHPDVATSLSDLATVYSQQGKYAEAEPLYKRSLAIREKALGPDHPDVAKSLSGLASLYTAQGRYAEAVSLLKRSLAIVEKSKGPDHRDVAEILENLAVLYHYSGKYDDEEERLNKRSLAIHEKSKGPDHLAVAQSLSTLGSLYSQQGKYAEAEPLLKRSLAITEKALGPDHELVGLILPSLAGLYLAQGRYADAEPLYKRSLAIAEKSYGPDHPVVDWSLDGLAELYWAQGKYAEAEPFFERDLQNLSRQFEYNFSYMSEKDRLEFLQQAGSTFPEYFSFCFAYDDKDPALLGKMYDLLLWEKGLVGSSVAALRARLAASGDVQAVQLVGALTAKKSESAMLATSRPDGWRESQSRVNGEANELEQQLARRVSSLAEQKTLARANWQDVQKTLAPGDAAVEVLKFQLYDGKKWTDKSYYIALVIRPESRQPGLALIGEARQIEGEVFSEYRAEVGNRGANASIPTQQTSNPPWRGLYDLIWEPLETPLGDAKRVYVSLDGALNEIPLGVLQRPDGRRVMEQYDVRVVSSTRDLLRPSHPATDNTATLVGNPRFLLSDPEQRAAIGRLRGPGKQGQAKLLPIALPTMPAPAALSRDWTERGTCDPPPPEGGMLCPLPGSATEVQSIADLLRGKNWTVSSYQDAQALEEVVKGAAHPRVLHLATHGFFMSDQQVKRSKGLSGEPTGLEDPMMRSGLFFAGADRMLKGDPPIEGVESGVLTAYEASTLNLQGTELVVLSACETGRGHVQSGEGVFGLRRALQEAGAQAVLMSLWSVPDRETQELMTLFYKNWLSGMEKPEALRRAQMTERDQITKRYGQDLPYYWGAFILVGR